MRKTAIALLLSFASALSAQNAYLVKDVNMTASDDAVSSSPANFFRHGSRIYFSAYTHATGTELFSTDGTEAGTAMVANIGPGSTFSSPSRFIDVNGNLLFNASDSRGQELWITDGTSAGTRVLADINSGGSSSAPGDRIVIGGRMLFSASDGINGRELWSTDGTPAGTRFFKDLVPGQESSDPRSFVAFNGAVYFAADRGLWKTDGTEAGTVLVKASIHPSQLVAAGSRLFFHAYTTESGTEPWVSDGTESGTRRVADIAPGENSSVSFSLEIAFGNRVLFPANDQTHGSEWWISDGTAAGTQMLVDAIPGGESGASFSAIVHDGIAYFIARTAAGGMDVWKSDGTPGGTTILRDVTPDETTGAGNFVVLKGTVHFVTGSSAATQFWTTDGTAEGTVPVATLEPGLTMNRFTNIDDTLYFSAANRLNGQEPWKSDGTAAGTSMIANIGSDFSPSSSPTHFKAAGDYLYFDAWDGLPDPDATYDDRESLWRTDGKPEGTMKLSNDDPGEYSNATFGRSVFFMREYQELWTSNGTPEGTVRLSEFQKRFPEGLQIRHILGDKVLVFSDRKLWTTTMAPGAPIAALGSEDGSGFVDLGGRAFYFSWDFHYDLWITDGTPGGTHVLTTNIESPGALTVMGGHVYFTTFGNPSKLWRSDGTAAGTIAVTTLPEGGGVLTAAGNRLFFIDGKDSSLWTSDGTAEGTRELPATPFGREIAASGNSVVFIRHAAATGRELWTSDGTAEGTRVLHEIVPGANDAYLSGLTAAGGLVFFSAYTAANGSELWVTDGTTAGTRMAADLEPGTGSSSPQQLTPTADRLYFSAITTATGRELWAMPFSLAPRVRIDSVRIEEADASLRFTVTLSSPATQNATVQYATSNGTATAGSDYDAATGTLTFAVGETTKTFDVRVRADAAMENNETFLVTLRNASGAAIETTTAAGIIEDDDVLADVGLALDFSALHFGDVRVEMTNAGPAIASNLRPRMTATPTNYGVARCDDCRMVQLAPGAKSLALHHDGDYGMQQYVTVTLSARERDPNAANNSIAWTAKGNLAMDALSLTPGGQANVWFSWFTAPTDVSLESSDPAVLTVPSSLTVKSTQAVSFVARAGVAGTATIRVFNGLETLATLVVDVIPPGTNRRWPGGFNVSIRAGYLPITSRAEFDIYTSGSAPFSGATATGVVTMTADGQEVGRVTLTPQSNRGRISFYLPDIGKKTVTLNYSGDANFLPVSIPYDLTVTTGYPEILATAVRTGTGVVVRMHVSGSPMAVPTGTIRIGDAGPEVPLTATGPGRARAEVTLHDVPASTTTLQIRYSGDARYNPTFAQVSITDERRRTVRH